MKPNTFGMKKKPRPDPIRSATLQEVAAAAGLAKSTVSVALRNGPRVSEATKRRVREVADRLGYQPDPVIARLAARRWKPGRRRPTVCVLHHHPLTTYEAETRKTLPRVSLMILDGVREAAGRLGYDVEHLDILEYPQPRILQRTLFHRGVEGLILTNIPGQEYFGKFDWEPFTVVQCQSGHLTLPFDRVVSDPHTGVVGAWERMRQRGMRRLGLATFDQTFSLEERLRQAAFLYLQDRDCAPKERIPILRLATPSAEMEFQEWMKRHRPDGVIGLTGLFHWWMVHQGWKVPQEVGFVSLIETGLDIPRAGMNPGYPRLGFTALKLLDASLRLNLKGIPSDPRVVFLEPEWVEGKTMGRRKRGEERGDGPNSKC